DHVVELLLAAGLHVVGVHVHAGHRDLLADPGLLVGLELLGEVAHGHRVARRVVLRRFLLVGVLVLGVVFLVVLGVLGVVLLCVLLLVGGRGVALARLLVVASTVLGAERHQRRGPELEHLHSSRLLTGAVGAAACRGVVRGAGP